MNTINTRSKFIDCLRAIAIILVVIGHAMQFGSGMHCYIYSDFFENIVFKIIYTFHMPLFMLVSGYLFRGSVMRNRLSYNVKSRFTTLLIPIMLWSIIPYAIRLMQGNDTGAWLVVRAYFTTCMGNFWFLWAVFYCSFIVIVVNRCFNDSIIVYMLTALVMLVTPDLNRLHLYKFMYGYFIVGYMLRKGNILEKLRGIKKSAFEIITILAGIIYVSLLLLYSRDCYIYTSGYTLLCDNPFRQLGIDVFRFVIGLVGCTFWIMISMLIRSVVQKIYAFNNDKFGKMVKGCIDFFAYIGRNTLGIYIISTLLFSYIAKPLAWSLDGINYCLVAAETVIVLTVSLVVIELVRKIPVLGRMLLGKM